MKTIRRMLYLFVVLTILISFHYAHAQPRPQYIGSKETKEYHHLNCREILKIHRPDFVFFYAAQQASNKKYTPCPVCNPPLVDEPSRETVKKKGAPPAKPPADRQQAVTYVDFDTLIAGGDDWLTVAGNDKQLYLRGDIWNNIRTSVVRDIPERQRETMIKLVKLLYLKGYQDGLFASGGGGAVQRSDYADENRTVLIEKIDQFYSDKRNLAIPVPSVIYYLKLGSLKGEDAQKKFLAEQRRIFSAADKSKK